MMSSSDTLLTSFQSMAKKSVVVSDVASSFKYQMPLMCRRIMQVPLGVLLKNEKKANDMIDIMFHLCQYVPTVDCSENTSSSEYKSCDSVIFHRILLGCDQLAAARARSL